MTTQISGLKNSKIRKRSIKVSGHSTSVSLEEAFWNALKEIAIKNSLSINNLIEQIDHKRCNSSEGQPCNLSSAIRVYILSNKIN